MVLHLKSCLFLSSLACLARASFNITNALGACQDISRKISGASEVIYQLDPQFLPAIDHWIQTSTQVPTCVLEAGSAEDISVAIQIIGNRKVPFAIKSGGHATNPGFSSTQGVHIYPGRINQVVLSNDKSVANVGVGQSWADVYKKLDGTGIGVNGGRVPGPGIGGFVLGGGYTWKTNQYGMTIDTVKSYTLVMPSGTITKIDASSPDLFFALKGGFNRFGIITSVELYTHTQGTVYGGINLYGSNNLPAIVEATRRFDSENTDPKAQVITTLQAGSLPNLTSAITIFFYDGPSKPPIFSLFDNITPITSNVKSQSFSSFVSSIPSKETVTLRGRFSTCRLNPLLLNHADITCWRPSTNRDIPVSITKLTSGFLDMIGQELKAAGAQSLIHGAGPFPPSYELDPFLQYGQYATNSAFSHADCPKPINLDFSWLSPVDDVFWLDFMAGSIARLKSYAAQQGILSPLAYGNYAITNTTAEMLYGSANAARLRSIRSDVDPQGVMNLAGGFSI